MSETARFTKEELDRLFPAGVPILAMKLLFPEKSQPLTLDEVRETVTALAALPRDAVAEKIALLDDMASTYPGDIDGSIRAEIAVLSTSPAPAAGVTEAIGWIVGSADRKRWRCWADGNASWTPDCSQATRYSRREDAEAVHREDEDAWTVVPYKEHEWFDRNDMKCCRDCGNVWNETSDTRPCKGAVKIALYHGEPDAALKTGCGVSGAIAAIEASEKQGQKPGERAVQGTPTDGQPGETSPALQSSREEGGEG